MNGVIWLFIVSGLAIVAWAVAGTQSFITMTTLHPLVMGFVKVFFLGTCGEILKKKGQVDKIWQRAFVWGLWGIWFVYAFPLFSQAVEFFVSQNLWPTGPKLWLAFSKSLWLCVLGGYAWSMMVAHEYFNHLIKTNWRVWHFEPFADQANPRLLISFLWKSILFFWLPAHTCTYLAPSQWRVLIAALLSVALGFILTMTAGKKAPSR